MSAITATRRRRADPDHRLVAIEARGGIVEATAHHRMLDADRAEVRADGLEAGDRVALADEFPHPPVWTVVSEEMAEFLGLMVADGWVARDGTTVCFTNNDPALRHRVAGLWARLFLGRSQEWEGRSGFDPDAKVGKLNLTGASGARVWLREQLYTRTAHKQVPELVLNADSEVWHAFLRGYYAGDGLKKGGGMSVKTNSPVLAQGLCWMYHWLDQPASVYVERRAGRAYYQLNLASAVRVGAKGAAPSPRPARDPAHRRAGRGL